MFNNKRIEELEFQIKDLKLRLDSLTKRLAKYKKGDIVKFKDPIYSSRDLYIGKITYLGVDMHGIYYVMNGNFMFPANKVWEEYIIEKCECKPSKRKTKRKTR